MDGRGVQGRFLSFMLSVASFADCWSASHFTREIKVYTLISIEYPDWCRIDFPVEARPRARVSHGWVGAALICQQCIAGARFGSPIARRCVHITIPELISILTNLNKEITWPQLYPRSSVYWEPEVFLVFFVLFWPAKISKKLLLLVCLDAETELTNYRNGSKSHSVK